MQAITGANKLQAAMYDDWHDDDPELPDEADVDDSEVDDGAIGLCPSCGAEMSELSGRCPACGDWVTPAPAGSALKRWGYLLLVILLAIGLLRWM